MIASSLRLAHRYDATIENAMPTRPRPFLCLLVLVYGLTYAFTAASLRLLGPSAGLALLVACTLLLPPLMGSLALSWPRRQ